jgi:two-component system LytT family response regulator
MFMTTTNPPTFKAIIVDDEPLAHDVLLHHLKELAEHPEYCLHVPSIAIVHQCYSATQALAWLANNSVDVMFLDINMPGLTGLELLKVLANRPHVILVSAYSEFALQGFELDVTDYLLKPVSAKRLSQALLKLHARTGHSNGVNHQQQSHFVVQVDRCHRKVAFDDILWLEAYGNYVKLWTEKEMLLVSSTLKRLLTELSGRCVQIHKSYAVNPAKVVVVDNEFVSIKIEQEAAYTHPSVTQVKIGKSFRNQAKRLLSI